MITAGARTNLEDLLLRLKHKAIIDANLPCRVWVRQGDGVSCTQEPRSAVLVGSPRCAKRVSGRGALAQLAAQRYLWDKLAGVTCARSMEVKLQPRAAHVTCEHTHSR